MNIGSRRSVGVVVPRSVDGGRALTSPPCGRDGRRVVALSRCFSRDGRSGRCPPAGGGGAVALIGKWGRLSALGGDAVFRPGGGMPSHGRGPRRCGPGGGSKASCENSCEYWRTSRGYRRNGRTSRIGVRVGWHPRHGGSHRQGVHRITCSRNGKGEVLSMVRHICGGLTYILL